MPPVTPDAHTFAVLFLVAIALVLFTRERLPLESSCLVILIALVIGFEVFPYHRDGVQLHTEEFFLGFGHEALVTICTLMILGRGLETTGALRPLATILSRLWSTSPMLSLLLTLFSAAVLSGFLNNTPIVVLLLPILISASLHSKQPASGILMPMGFSTLVGGMGTTIGTSTNLLVVGIAADLGIRQFGMFDFIFPAAITASIAIIYLWLIAPRLLPERTPILADTSPRVFEALLHIEEESFANGKTVAELLEKTSRKMRIETIYRSADLHLSKLPTAVILAGDRLLVRDLPENLKEFERLLGAKLYSFSDVEAPISDENPLSAKGQQLAEIIVTEHSPLFQTTLRRARFAERYGLAIVAIHRTSGASIRRGDISDTELHLGDVLLAQGAADNLKEIKNRGDVLVLDATVDLPHTNEAPLALAIMLMVVLLAAFGIASITVTALAGMGLMLMTRCLTWQDAADALSTQVILIVAVSLALGHALMATGGAEYLAHSYVALVAGWPPEMIISGLMLLMAILTNVVSNNAAAVIGTPIAISIAQQLGLPPVPFILAVLFGANMSYATPMAYKTNLLIFNAGGYKFSDFMRVGIPLTIIVWVSLSILLPIFFPLR
ncbi:TrkA-C domain protein [hydrothermal vent metagenome]|uniref:TrkA-C domain protein n=1 Tax=hydrothermal vent metagenome TaxID=652676 RepID=A0A3B1B7C1_9ZZZZ